MPIHVKDQYCAGPNCDCGYGRQLYSIFTGAIERGRVKATDAYSAICKYAKAAGISHADAIKRYSARVSK